MNQQLIFNHDFSYDDKEDAVHCSCLAAGLRLAIYIKKPEGWDQHSWLAQIKEDCFYWEEQIEEAAKQDRFTAEGILYLDGSA
jgi:hypothetical protein